MKTICIFNQKGGVGKTTTNINLCSGLAMMGYKVLAIDIDPQGNTTSGLGFDKTNLKYSIYDILTSSDVKISDAIIQSQLVDNLYLIPANMDLAGAEVEMIESKDREKILKEKLKEYDTEFDFIFIDCPPSLGILTLNALTACDSVIIPIQCEFYALEGVGQLINTINLVRNNLCNEVFKEVKNYFKDKVYTTKIPRNIRLAEAPSFGLPILLYDDKCRGAEAYDKLTKEFIKRQEVK